MSSSHTCLASQDTLEKSAAMLALSCLKNLKDCCNTLALNHQQTWNKSKAQLISPYKMSRQIWLWCFWCYKIIIVVFWTEWSSGFVDLGSSCWWWNIQHVVMMLRVTSIQQPQFYGQSLLLSHLCIWLHNSVPKSSFCKNK